ncbi:hypothetical protein K1T71_002975 [Dendrolimus kikuchii]|uniref:Uncharacterized protein n=1 Tax=Dendrolimus kikuchii TaxID=765133 RepID=A0ACC1DAM9_9NEOP|nr:hypothetical protein K1T71_002975 [Dendrolimus kikuchii]
MDISSQKPKKKPRKIEDMTKEQIHQAILKKRECNAKAQNIVESLLEKDITEKYLLKCLPDINQSHFEDVIEERSIIHLCGYPICSKTISENEIPKQKYKISIKTNKVYDITTRKNFCSNECYKSAMYVKKQLLTSPLWFREYEDIPKFCLLPLGTGGSMGLEVDVAFVEKIKIQSEKISFASINDFTNASLKEMTGENKNDYDAKEKDDNTNITEAPDTRTPSINKDTIVSNYKIESKISEVNKENCEKINDKKLFERCLDKVANEQNVKKKQSTTNPLNIVGEIIERPEKRIDPILISMCTPDTTKDNKKNIQIRKQPLVTALTIEVEKCLAEWFTLDTIIFVFGEEKAKEMVADKGEVIKEYLNNYSKSIFYNSNAYDQYQDLCRKLNMLELEDKRFDSETLSKEKRPLPDYSILKEESKKMQLKVKAFLSGETELQDPEAVEEQKQTDAVSQDGNFTQLPLVDKNSQNALRRRIVCQHLNKVLPDLLRSLGLLSLSVSSEIRLLVNTFRLKANNIMFKPIQWTLITIVFMKLLSLRDERLESLLEQPTAYQHMQLLLLSYKQDGGYLDRLISWLTDIDRLLDTNDTQLTIE